MSLTSAEKKDNNIVEFEVAATAAQLKEATDKVFKTKVKTLTVPGFRKGKAPRKIIEKMYGEGIFYEDAVNELYPVLYSEAVEESGYEPVDKAEVEILEIDKETGLKFKATVTVKPEIEVGAYKGIEAEKVIYEVKEEEIDSEIDAMRERSSRLISVDDRAAKLDDEVIIDFEGFIDGVPFEGGKAERHNLKLGSNSFIDTFEEQIAGHKIGEEFDVNVTFPENYHAEELKNKPALFKIKLHEIKMKELPEVDDEFVKDVSEFDTIQELRADIKAKLQESKDKTANDDFENALIDEICKDLKGDIPEIMYENKIDDMVNDFAYRLSSQGMNVELYLQYTGMDMDSFRKTFREQAERQVKIRLALEKIAQTEKLEISEEEINAEYKKIAEMYKMEEDKIKNLVSVKDISADLKNNKAVDFVKDSAKVKEVKEADKKKEEEAPAKKAPAKKAAAKKTEKAGTAEKADAKEEKAKKAAPKKTAKKAAEKEAAE